MLYVDRVNYIKQMLAKNNSVTVVELSRDLGVSGETIRRDLNTLTKDDPMIVRVHGGACRVTPDADPPYEFRQISRVEEKSKIANACFSRISEGDFLFLDSSTTTLYLAKRIAASELNLTVITNSVGVINELRHNKNIKLICIGGKYTDATHSFVGSTSLIDLSNIFAGKAFISCSGIDIKFGITHNNEEEAAIRRLMMLNSKERYLLIDSNKFRRCKTHRITTMDNVDYIYTDWTPDSEWCDFFKKNHIELRTCKV